jgi:DNA-binding transcriptional regulator GbsR (MarR family)
MDLDNERLRQFIENSADLMEEHGFPHMAGRVIGALLICTPPYLSHEELAEQLQASKGSISMSTQLLMRLNFVERISLPGQRRHFYRLRENLWKDFLSEIVSHTNREREVVMDGLAALEGEPVEMKRRLIEMLVVSDFVLEEWPGLVSRWEARRGELLKKHLTEMAQDAETRK